ncbi:hypothetical protein KL930_001180 [Ogataea haglerorum]|uniref:DASH complex subunit DAM1 n=1 Tax=Ogataea haglerorum TaxID=1937702 RepID=A0AAN6D1L4_9ASCO|nr:hypothetical protein KL915_005211 [Ogataea haglerorum]KAG7698402.1 hypothetical protein KL951_001666 [Ogataea haglerorum]KAG7708105.1 hypothetical protein KL950_002731 [Ogataea haglerorum]KAG7714864.1 hypothetical protein KL913_004185 [Ogataea haglerorum]KAG7719516.1 hypothetical protein KL949_002508 [Ogataea haglerorum]
MRPLENEGTSSRLPIVRPATPNQNRRSMRSSNLIGTSTSPASKQQHYPLSSPYRSQHNPPSLSTPGSLAQSDSTEAAQDGAPASGESDLPFFDKARQFEFIDHLDSIHMKLLKLNEIHESLTNFNESFGSFLFGLNINAWCVNFEEAPIPKTWNQKQQLDEIQAKIDSLQAEVEKLERERKDRTTMPPPGPGKSAQTRQTPARRSYLRGSSRVAPSSTRRQSSIPKLVRSHSSSLNQTPVQKPAATPGSRLNLSSAKKSSVRPGSSQEDEKWQVKGRKPFR